ncbi:MAG: basic amino acid ABC transporter substrate-binding protein [Chloroflexota bacterium]
MRTGLRNVLLVSLVAVLIVAAVSGCGPKQSPGYAAVMKAKKLIVGTEAGFQPFEFADENNNIIGFDIDLAAEIAKDLGVEMEVQDMKFDALIPALQTGKINMIAAGFSIKPDRLEVVDFSEPYADAGQSIVVTMNNVVITKADDLAGKRIGVQSGTTGDDTITETYKDATITRYDRFTDAFLDLQNGNLDAVVLDQPVAQAYVSSAGGKLKVVGEPLSSEKYALAFQKGAKELVESANKTLARMKQDGSFDKLIQKWFK